MNAELQVQYNYCFSLFKKKHSRDSEKLRLPSFFTCQPSIQSFALISPRPLLNLLNLPLIAFIKTRWCKHIPFCTELLRNSLWRSALIISFCRSRWPVWPTNGQRLPTKWCGCIRSLSDVRQAFCDGERVENCFFGSWLGDFSASKASISASSSTSILLKLALNQLFFAFGLRAFATQHRSFLVLCFYLIIYILEKHFVLMIVRERKRNKHRIRQITINNLSFYPLSAHISAH